MGDEAPEEPRRLPRRMRARQRPAADLGAGGRRLSPEQLARIRRELALGVLRGLAEVLKEWLEDEEG